MKKKLLFLLISAVCVSCNSPKNQIEKILLRDEYWYYDAVYFPLQLSLYGELEKDTINVMLSAKDLVEDINIKIIPHEIFPKLLYNEIEDNNGCINVEKDIFEWYRRNAIIEKNNILDSIYNIKGISGLLNYAVDENGRLIKLGKEGNYIMYLCFQHGIYFYTPYNDPWIYVNLKTLKDIPKSYIVK